MQWNLIQHKLNRPSLPAHTVTRDRLFADLDRWEAYRCVYVHAPAGYGKSVLVSSWVETQLCVDDPASVPVPTAWLSFDRDDIDETEVLGYLVAALDDLRPGIMALVEPLLHDPGTPTNRALVHLVAILQTFETTPSLLVLDDYHRVKSQAVDDLIDLLLDRAPQWLHFVLISRQSTAGALRRPYAAGQVLELNHNDLRFQRDEMVAYLAAGGITGLREETLDLLLDRTEGWIAALQLAGHAALLKENDATMTGLRGDKSWLARYLTDGLLDRQSPERRRFLLTSSLLNRFNVQLVTAVTGVDNAYRLLHEVRDANLFLISLDDRNEWFRYHHLFQELLQHRLLIETSTETIGILRRRAAEWLAEAGDIDAALDHFLAIPDVDAAVDLVAANSRPNIVRGYSHMVKHWLDLLPESAVSASISLMLIRCLLSMYNDDPALLDHVYRTETMLPSSPCWSAKKRAELLVYRTAGHFSQGDFAAMVDASRRVLSQLELLDNLTRGHLHFILMHRYLHEGRLEAAFDHGEQAADVYTRAEFAPGLIAIRREIAGVAMLAGFSEVATRQYVTLANFDYADHPSSQREMGVAHLRAARHYYWLDQLGDAHYHRQAALAIMNRLYDPGFIAESQCMGALLHAAAPKVQPSAEIFAPDVLAKHTIRYSTPLLYWIWLLMLRGEVAEAWKRVGDSEATIQSEMPVHDLAQRIAVLTASTLRGHELASVTATYEQALDEAEAEGRQFYRLLLLSLFAWHQLRLGKRAAAERLLDDALGLAERTGYIRTILDLRELMPLLAASSHPLADKLLQQMEGESAQQTSIYLTPKERLVLELLAQDYKYRDIADHMVISMNTVRFHVRNIYAKLGTNRRLHAIELATKVGLIDDYHSLADRSKSLG